MYTQPKTAEGQPIQVYTHSLTEDTEVHPHCHNEGQIWAIFEGIVTTELNGRHWTLPQGRICWIPPGVVHSARTQHAVNAWMAYLRPDLCHAFPEQPAVFVVTELTQALIQRINSWYHYGQSTSHDLTPAQQRLMEVLLDELLAARTEPMCLPMPSHPGLYRMAYQLMADPADKRSLAEWASYCGLSERGLSRHFRSETGLSLVEWRTQARMTRAVQLLMEGQSVTAIALEVGYDSISNFISTFRRHFGVTPTQYRG